MQRERKRRFGVNAIISHWLMMALTPKRLFLSLCISISLLRLYTFFSRSHFFFGSVYSLWKESRVSWVVSVHTSSPPTVHAAYLRCLCDCSKCDSSGFALDSRNSSWSIARLKEYLRKKEDTVVCCSRKPSFLNAQYLSIVISHTHCVAGTPPVLFQMQPEAKKKKKKASWYKLRLHCNLFPCFLPASDSEWPQHLAQTTAGTNVSLSLRVRASYSHSGLAPMRAKRKHRWHCTCFREVSSLTLFQKTGDGRVHRLLGTSMIAKIFLREDVLNAYDRAVGDEEMRPVSLTNLASNQRFLSSLDRENHERRVKD